MRWNVYGRAMLLMIIVSWLPFTGRAQFSFLNPSLPRDSSYIRNYPRDIVGRALMQRKYTNFRIPGNNTAPGFRYLSNGKLSVGAGIIYRAFNLNISYGLPYLTDNWKERGKTRALDLQTYIFGRKWMYNLYGEFYGGYHINKQGFVPGYEGYYYRDDVRLRLIGGTGYYIFNPKRFSFRMALLQDEWQYRSSGTFLLNFGAYYGLIYSKNDKTIIPVELADQYNNADVVRYRFINFGPGAGYAYNYVFRKNFFVSGMLSANIMAAFTREKTVNGYDDQPKILPNISSMLSAGYNTDRWIFTLTFINNGLFYKGVLSERNYNSQTGLYRFTVAHRFRSTHASRKFLKPVDESLKTNIFHRIFKKKSKQKANDIPGSRIPDKNE